MWHLFSQCCIWAFRPKNGQYMCFLGRRLVGTMDFMRTKLCMDDICDNKVVYVHIRLHTVGMCSVLSFEDCIWVVSTIKRQCRGGI